MNSKHVVLKWVKDPDGYGYFKEVWSESTKYYSLASYLDGDEDQVELETDTLAELYKLWKKEKEADEAVGEKGRWKYHFYYHCLVEENGCWSDYITPIKIYRRGNKIFSKPL